MFKSATIYRILATDLRDQLATLADSLDIHAFTPCDPHQEKSVGWVPPRGQEHGALLEVVGGQWIGRFMVETKTVPAQAIRDKVDEQCKSIEAQTGRKPGKKERRDLSDDARQALLPHAFSKRVATWLWIDPKAQLLVLDTASQACADEVMTGFIKAVGGLSVALIHTQTSAAAAMAHWLREREAPQSFSVGRECELKAADESRTAVRYTRAPLDTDEVVQHVTKGMQPSQLALTWNDRISFVLTNGLQLKKLAILDVVFEEGDVPEDEFDADVAIATGELRTMIPDLLSALGGEVVVSGGAQL